MIYLDGNNEEFEPFEHPSQMPAKVILEEKESPEAVLTTLKERYAKIADEFAHQELSRHYSRETRYDDGIEEPTFPVVILHSAHSSTPRSIVILPDGRKAVMLDAHRIQTLCGVQEIMPLSHAQQLSSAKKGHRLCRQCQGKHLPELRPTPIASVTVRTTLPCEKCHADLRSSSYWDGADTLVCIPCGTRLERPLTALTQEETDANETALLHLPIVELDGTGTVDATDEEESMTDGPDESGSDEDTLATDTDDIVSPFDDDITVDVLPEATPLTTDELADIQAMLDDPTQRHNATTHSTVLQHLLALTTLRMQNPADDEAFKIVFAEVVGEEVGQLGDLIHAPACDLFKSSRSPLRQLLVDRAIQNHDPADRRMAIWAAVGRLLNESNVAWLKDFRANIMPATVPQQKKARAEFWQQIQASRKADAQPILDWLSELSREDLALLAGDPETTHPFVHHPDPDVFQSTDTLINPLIRYIANELQRFRQKESGCHLLAGDYGLSVDTLKTIARQTGQLPVAPQVPSATAA